MESGESRFGSFEEMIRGLAERIEGIGERNLEN